jgi:FtsH-binding integral membrane protein
VAYGAHGCRTSEVIAWEDQQSMNENMAKILSTPSVRERSILKNVYLWMTAGLGLTALVAWLVARTPALMSTLVTSQFGVLLIVVGMFALVFFLSARLQQMSVGSAIVAFLGYSALTGVMLSTIFYAFAIGTVYRAFFTTAVGFAGMSIYGMTTKRNLDGIGYYLGMALWGIIIASLLNFLFRSSSFDYIISIVGIVVFMGLTAWDTQKIQRLNDEYGYRMTEEEYHKLSIMGALMLYLDFLNIFLYILRIFGRRDN